MRARVSTAAALALALAASIRPARADDVAREAPAADEKSSVRWHGTTLSFDQSATTQTFGVGGDYQSADPTYEWWLAFRPRYFVYEKGRDAVSINAWLNLYLELTNSDTTTKERELLLGPTYLWATWARVLRDRGGSTTTVSIGPRLTIPTDKAARDVGEILGLGASAGVTQTFPLARHARAFQTGRAGISAIYTHPLWRSASPVNEDINQLRQDVEGFTIHSDLVRGQMNVENALSLAFSGEVQVVRRLDLSASYVLLDSWAYPISRDALLTPPTGPVQPMDIADPTTFRVSTWMTIAVGYLVTPELSLSLGYYNLASQIGPDGTRRSPFWSPNARAFFTITGNLDAVYERLRRRYGS
jgi:hypothetical protein